MTKVYIYTLSCPDTGQVMYVGQSVDVDFRYIQHIETSSLFSRRPKDHWIAELKRDGKLPSVAVIDECEHENANIVEAKWISHFSALNPEIKNVLHNENVIDLRKKHFKTLDENNPRKTSANVAGRNKSNLRLDIDGFIGKIQAHTSDKVTYSQLASVTTKKRYAIQSMAANTSYQDLLNVLSDLIDFAKDSGVDVSIADLFTVTDTKGEG